LDFERLLESTKPRKDCGTQTNSVVVKSIESEAILHPKRAVDLAKAYGILQVQCDPVHIILKHKTTPNSHSKILAHITSNFPEIYELLPQD
jgi:hypothetical protein